MLLNGLPGTRNTIEGAGQALSLSLSDVMWGSSGGVADGGPSIPLGGHWSVFTLSLMQCINPRGHCSLQQTVETACWERGCPSSSFDLLIKADWGAVSSSQIPLKTCLPCKRRVVCSGLHLAGIKGIAGTGVMVFSWVLSRVTLENN